MRASLVGLWLAASLACSQSSKVGPPPQTMEAIDRSPFASAIAAPRALRASSAGYSFEGALPGRFPLRASAAIELAASHSVAIVPLDLRDVAGVVDRGVVRYPAAADGADVVWSAAGDLVEELRVLPSQAAYHHARYRIEADALVRVRDGRIEVVDEDGRLIVGTAPVEAAGADGTRRALSAVVTRDDRGFVVTVEGSLEGLRAPIVIDPVWSTVGSMAVARSPNMGVLGLSDGRALVAGGYGPSSVAITTAEIYDPTTSTWSAAGTINTSYPPTLIEMPSKKVLSVATFGSAKAQLWDPATKSFTEIATSPSPCVGPLVRVGASVLIFDGTTLLQFTEPSTFTTRAAPPAVRTQFGMTRLADGRVLVAGGYDAGGKMLGTANIYDPTTNGWSATGSFVTRRAQPILVTLASGKVLAIGGNSAGGMSLSQSELYDPTTGTWSTGPSSPGGMAGVTVASVGGRYYVAGGANDTVYDPITNSFGAITQPTPLRLTEAAPIAGGRVIIPGGQVVGGSGGPSAVTSVFTPLAKAAACNAAMPGECATGVCADSVCCDRACTGTCERCNGATVGTCSASTTPRNPTDCGAYAKCTAGACSTSCTVDGDCSAGNHCKGGACVPLLAAGAKCTAGAECATGLCVDGVCCKSACSGQCEACDASGDGTCIAVAGAPRGGRAACAAGDPECGLVCDGVTRTSCVYLPAGTSPCSKNGCSAGIETHASTCNGSGACSDTPKTCGAYACGTTACKSACSSKFDCSAGNVCVGGACVTAPGLGSSCSDPSACSTGNCVDGVCCATASCGAGSTCAAPGHEGTCIKKNGVACTADGECATNHCVDGVCCESTCEGACEACDVSGQAGKCSPVRGAPHGKRPACAGTGCDAKVCDGKDTTTCAGFVGAEVTCRPATCVDGQATAASSCDGNGACPTAAPHACGLFRCDKKGEQCLVVCENDADCIDGYTCFAGRCRSKAAACSDDGLSEKHTDGTLVTCAPYLCKGGSCVTSCGTSDDCAGGYVCDGTACVAAPTASDSGGCSMGTHGSGSFVSALAILGVMFALRRRTRALAAAGVLLGCRGEPQASDVDAGASPVVKRDLHVDLGSTLARFPNLALRPDARASVVAEGGGLRVVGAPYRAQLPPRASGVMHLEREARPDLFLDVSLLGDDVAGVIDGAGVVYPNAKPSTDIALVPVEGGFEDLRVLADEKAAPKLEYAVAKGPAVARIVKRGAHVVAFDHEGIVRFSMHAPFAVDAEGTRRTLDVQVEDGPTAHVRVALDTRGLRFPIAIDPVWSVSATSTYAYGGHMFGHLPGNAVILVQQGGREEKLDLSTNTWSMQSGLSHFTDQLNWAELAPGKFLIFAGYTLSEVQDTWIWQPGSDAVAGPATKFPRSYARVATLSTNVILTAGGITGVGTPSATGISTAEIYDPVANTWTAVGAMSIPRYQFRLVPLPGGKALAVGGENSYFDTTPYSTAEIFDPATKTWTATTPMKHARVGHHAVALSSGKVLVAGGVGTVNDTTAEVYDPTTKTWTMVGSMVTNHEGGTMAPLGTDRAILIGGAADSTAEIYDHATKTWARASDLPTDRTSAVPLTVSGQVLFGGGFSVLDGAADTVWTYTPTAVGGACARDGDCGSLHCVDGVCCSTACNGPCQVCNATGSVGTCTGVSGLPHTGHPSCAPYVTCTAGACATSCSGPSDCATDAYCSGSICISKKANGGACATALDCLSGNCADGVCCNMPCDGSCEACAEAGNVGSCIAVTGAPRGSRTACAGGTGTCAARCDGVTRKICTFPPKTAACGTDACTSGVETHKRTCDGIGHCSDVPKACGAFACGATTCKTTCAANTDCAAGFICKSSACVPAPGLGEPCDATKPCTGSLSCTDGVCCGVAACPTGQSCGLPTTRGICAKIDGQSCTSDGECGSGACTDGVCCESACAGQCQACDVAGSVGKCVSVKGAPHGSRVACAAGATTCEATTCDGTDGSSCVAFAGTDVSCRAESCTDSVRTEPASCDGTGKCPAAVKTSCSPYGCAGNACATSCTTSEDCAAGFLCHAGKCESPKADCSPDNRSIIDGAGRSASCAPFLCRDGACLESCATTDDCTPGTICDTGKCVAAPAAGAEDTSSGCAFGRKTGTAPFLGLAVAALVLARARRKRVRVLVRD